MKKTILILTFFTALSFWTFSFSQSGCKVDITEAPQLTIISAIKTPITCSGSPDGKITITAGGGTGSYQYSKDNGITFQPSNIFTGLASGSYSIVVKDANDCSSAATSVSIDKTTCISISKTVDNPTPNVGNNVVFTVTVKNNGPDNATNVNVTDALPSGYTLVSSSATAGTYNTATRVWTIGGLANGASATLTITAKVNATGTYANTATVAGSETDPDTSDNTSTVTPNSVPVANLKVVKTVDNIAPKVGDNVTFTIKVTNNGPSAASSVVANDLLPSGYTLVSSSATAGTYNTATGVWTIGGLANGASATLTMTATVVAASSYTNIATVTATETDPDTTDNTDSKTIEVSLTYTKSDVTCFGENTGWIKVTAVGGSGKYYFSLDGGTTFTALQNSNDYTFAGLKAGTYYIVVKDSNGIISVCK